MPKFLYCLKCNGRIQLRRREFRKCSCGNFGGQFCEDGKSADVCAKNPIMARFIEIGFNSVLFESEKKTKYPEIYKEIINQDMGLYEQIELYPELKNTKAWEDFEILMNEFFEKDTDDKWAEYEKHNIAENKEDWERILREKGYVVGKIESLRSWHRRWYLSKCLCDKLSDSS